MFAFWAAAPFVLLFLAMLGKWLWIAAAVATGLFATVFANCVFHPLLMARRADEIPADEIGYLRKFRG